MINDGSLKIVDEYSFMEEKDAKKYMDIGDSQKVSCDLAMLGSNMVFELGVGIHKLFNTILEGVKSFGEDLNRNIMEEIGRKDALEFYNDIMDCF